MKKQFILSAACMLFMASPAASQDHSNHHSNHAEHAYGPVGIMGEHPHGEGEWMMSYRYGTMQMQGSRDRTGDVSTADVLSDFMVAPTKMTMEMHMFGLMYGVSDRLTLMGMLPYNRISMDHVTRMGAEFITESKGVGDVKLSGLYTLYEQGARKFMLNAGLSVPTGSIDERDDTPAGANQKLPYAMQLGSGTYDMLPGVTYTDGQGVWSWGSQLSAVVRLDKNDNDYRLGNQYELTTWGARQLFKAATVSVRLDGKKWGNISGSDAELNSMMVPTARTDLRGGERVDMLFGASFTVPDGKLQGNRLAIEVGLPIYQKLDGPQLEADYHLMIGWQLDF